MYDKSNVIAVIANIALDAMGLARSSKPGRMLKSAVNQIARSGVWVCLLT